jgi:deoxyribodipyrimidine photolyase
MPEITNFVSGEDAAISGLMDSENGFCSTKRIRLYDSKRNDPNYNQALSNLSPYFHFG